MSGSFTATESGPVLLDMFNWKDEEYATLCVNFIDNLRVYPENADFSVNKNLLSCQIAGKRTFSLEAGSDFAGKTYLILSSFSGTWPGFGMSGVAVPLNVDDWTWIALTMVQSPVMQNFMGQLDGNGAGSATLDAPTFLPTSLIGSVLHFDYVVLENPASAPVVMASHPVHIMFMP